MISTTASIQAELAADQAHLDSLFASFRRWKRPDFARAKALFKEFLVAQQRHLAWEEQILLPLYEQKTGLAYGGSTEVMRRQQRHIGAHLETLREKVRQQDPNSENEEWGLLAALAVHNEKAEHVLYRTLDRSLSDEEKTEAFAAMKRVPEEALQICCEEH